MNSPARFAIALIAVLLPLAVCAKEAAPRAVPEAFLKQLVAGINARDLAMLRDIIHPETLKCMTPETADYYAWWLWKDGSRAYTVAPDYKVRLEKPVDVARAEAGMAAMSFTPLHWPVQPDIGMHLTYHTAPMSMVERLFEITLSEGQAKLVIDCPTTLGLKKFHQKKAETAEKRAHLRQVWGRVSPDDRKTLLAMANQGQKLKGMEFAQKQYQLEMDDALSLMDMIQYEYTP